MIWIPDIPKVLARIIRNDRFSVLSEIVLTTNTKGIRI